MGFSLRGDVKMRPSHAAVSAGLSSLLDLDRDGVAEQELARRLVLDRVEGEVAAHAVAGADRGDEADPVEAVIDRHHASCPGPA